MPAFIQNQKEKEFVTRTKKIYSILNQAYLQAVNENGTPDNWDLKGEDDPEGSVNMMNVIKKYVKTVKTCMPNEQPCFAHSVYKLLNGNVYADFSQPIDLASMSLTDGSVVSFEPFADCDDNRGNMALKNICGSIFVDVNGNKGPNTLGIDMLSFYLTKNGGIIPRGTVEEEGSYEFLNDCGGGYKRGYGCAAWVIYNENMDYTKCPEKLGWEADKAKKCSK